MNHFHIYYRKIKKFLYLNRGANFYPPIKAKTAGPGKSKMEYPI